MSKEPVREPMVGWYNPTQLLETGKKTLISTIIGKNADPRLVAASTVGGKSFDYSKKLKPKDGDFEEISGEDRNEIWLDYVSDVGDGWNSTYSVAYSLAQQNIKIPEREEPLERGEILIFGGDEVYPTASQKEYDNRLIMPYKMAFNSSRTTDETSSETTNLAKNPHVFVVPGNHDWYDSLATFQRIFCTHFFNDRMFADAWRTRQERSYFALKLPHNWWLLGIDFQLSHDIDVRQLRYFESLIKSEMKKGDKVILCVPEPYWVKVIKYQGMTEEFDEKEGSVARLEKKIISDQEAEIKVYLAGDLHHYRRFESGDGKQVQKITAGGGGAFLHPTHDFNYKENTPEMEDKSKGFSLVGEYPSFDESKKKGWANFYAFLFKNGRFGILTAILYAILAWMIKGEVVGGFTWRKALGNTLNSLIYNPLASLIVLITLIGLVFFTDSNSTIYRRVAGAIHGLTHLTAIFFLGWLSFLLMLWYFGINTIVYQEFRNNHPTYVSLVWFVCILLVCGVGGYIIGSIIMGIYLGISLQIFKRHDNEAFSALKIEDCKNFLRLHIDTKGALTIYPIKIEKVPRDWTPESKNGKEFFSPNGELKPELIEDKPITI